MVSSSELDWTKFILLLGKPGTGKTHTVCTSVRRTLEDRFLVAVAGPTGFLASLYRAEFDEEALIDTVDAMFHYPVDTHVAPSVNWSLCEYDLLLIDEVSMIPKKIFQHILRTLQDVVKGVVKTYPVSIWRNEQLFTSYPFVPAYGLTITKAQGQTLRGAIIWLDSPAVPDGGAYVALSRIRKFIDLRFLVETVPAQYKPVTMIPS